MCSLTSISSLEIYSAQNFHQIISILTFVMMTKRCRVFKSLSFSPRTVSRAEWGGAVPPKHWNLNLTEICNFFVYRTTQKATWMMKGQHLQAILQILHFRARLARARIRRKAGTSIKCSKCCLENYQQVEKYLFIAQILSQLTLTFSGELTSITGVSRVLTICDLWDIRHPSA